MNEFFDFLLLKEPGLRNVVLGTSLLSVCTALIGTFTILRKRALSGDVISHAILPGICLAFMFSGEKNIVYLMAGAFASGWLSLILVDKIVQHSKIKEDTALAIILSSFYGLGVVLLKIIDKLPDLPDKAGLNNYLFGSATQIVRNDLINFGAVGLIILLILFIYYRYFKILSFDPIFAKSTGLNVPYLEFLLTSLTVLAVIIGIQTVGVVLMAAMLITPGAIALFWTKKLHFTLLLAALFGIVSSWLGCFTSYFLTFEGAYGQEALPTGPSIVMYLSMFGILSFFFTPKKGILSKFIRKTKFKKRIQMENLLKSLYKNFGNSKTPSLCFNEIKAISPLPSVELKKSLSLLTSAGYLIYTKGNYVLTEIGLSKGRRVTKIHRLWELYLTTHMNVDAANVHDDAESIEHILTPELEKSLEEQLNFPEKDPHDKPIPYNN